MKSKNYSYNPLITEIIGICLLFLISRLLILFVLPIWYSDIPYYATIAEYASIANDRGLYLNDIKTFEYPPLAAFLLEIPNSFINENLISTSTYRSLYNYYFRLTIFLFDCIAFTFVLLSAFHLYPNNSAKIFRVATIYIISTLILFNLAYDRLDLLLMCFMLACYYFQIKQNYIISAIFLSLGIFLKLIPVLFIPLWLMGWCLTVKYKVKQFIAVKNWNYAIKALISLLISSLVLTLISIYFYGPDVFDFLIYHTNRGIQIESVPSTLIQIANWIGIPYYIDNSYGSQNIVSSITPILSTLSPFLILLGMTVVLIKLIQNKKIRICFTKPFCVKHPEILNVAYISSFMAIFICSKVLSTQFFLLPIPFIAIFLSNKNIHFSILWITILVLTTFIFPYLYFTDIVPISRSWYENPSLLGTSLMLIRNFLLIYLFFYFVKKIKLSE